MPTLTPETWARIRADYEHSDRPIDDICAEHGISSGTLRDRMRRWGWTRRRPPTPLDGPPSVPLAPVTPGLLTLNSEPSPLIEDTVPIGERLHSAVARVMPALETTLAGLAAGPMPPRQMEQAARTLGALTRTLRELTGLLAQHAPGPAQDPPQDVEALRRSVARKLDAVIAEEQEAMPRRYLAGWEEFAQEAEAADDCRTMPITP